MSVLTEPRVSAIVSGPPSPRGNFSLGSVVEQSRSPCEIVVTAASIPGGFETFAQSPVPLISIDGDVSNIAASRNTAIRSSRGEWIALLTPGVVWHREKLASCLNVLKTDPGADVVYHLVAREGESSLATSAKLQQAPSGWVHEAAYARRFVPDSAVVFRRRIWERIGGFDPSLSHTVDHNFWVRAAVAHKFVVVPKVLAEIPYLEDVVSPEDHVRRLREEAEMLHRYFEEQGGKERLIHKTAIANLIRLCREGGRLASRIGDTESAVRFYEGLAYYGRTWSAVRLYRRAQRRHAAAITR